MESRNARGRLRWRPVALGLVLVIMLCTTACGADLGHGQAGQARNQADVALQQAGKIGVSATVLAHLRQQRDAIDGQRGWFGISDATAVGRYQALLTTTQQAESDAQTQTHNQAQTQVDLLSTVIQQQNAPAFQPQLDALRTRLSQATTPNENQAVIQDAEQAQDAIHEMVPARTALAQLQAAIGQMTAAGLPADLAQTRLARDQQAFASAKVPADFDQVTQTVQADLVAAASDQAQAIPFLASNLVHSLHDRIDLLQTYGEHVTAYQPGLALAQSTLPTVTTLATYTTFAQQVQGELNTTALPLAHGQAHHDLAQLQTLIDYAHQHTILSYEYEGDWGLPDVQQNVAAAQTADDFRRADDEAMMLVTNLRAMITNLSDPTPYNQPHATDADLMTYYHATTGKVIVISLREQALRAYDNGQLVMAIYVTSGRPELPSPPGFTQVTERLSPTVFSSDAPKGSAFYYNPTFINYALLYHDGGYFIHDAWWRLQFGPGSNLPHYDPDAFNGGSHGCVNLPLQQMAQLYNWTPLGTPVILY